MPKLESELKKHITHITERTSETKMLSNGKNFFTIFNLSVTENDVYSFFFQKKDILQYGRISENGHNMQQYVRGKNIW